MRQFAPWILAAVAVAAIFPAVKLGGQKKTDGSSEREKVEQAAEESAAGAEAPQDPSNPCRPSEGKEEASWCEPLRVLRDFYGLSPVSATSTIQENLQEIALARDASGYRMRFLVALVPDPVESQIPYLFDSALDAIQKGFAEEGHLFDRFWLPWIGEEGKKDRLYRAAPGVLLFRRSGEQGPLLRVVFLVGESPKAGIHKRAFLQAMKIAAELRGAGAPPGGARIDILGPAFSGSVDSLVMALKSWRRDDAGTPLRIASGSATAKGLETAFKPVDGSSFCRTVVPDHLLQREAFRFLEGDEMKWGRDSMALLAESDTGYGQASPNGSQGIVSVRFPSGISDLRNAWQRREQEQRSGEREVKLGDTLLSTSREALGLSLQDRDKALDSIPRFSPLTTLARDQEMAVLLETISRDSIRYVGVLATDLKDRLFVMERVRRFAPDTVLFTFDSDILLGHVDYSAVMDGVVVISSSPLFTEGASWLPRSYWGKGRERRQFQGETHQGMFEAVRYLLDAQVRSVPQVWISVVGNGALWPLAELPLKERDGTTAFCWQPPQTHVLAAPPGRLSEKQGGLAGKANLQVIFFAVALCLVSWGLRRAGRFAQSGAGEDDVVWHPVHRPLVTMGVAILALSAAVLLVVAAIPEWAWYYSDAWDVSSWGIVRILFLLALAGVYIYLCQQLMRVATRGEPAPWQWALWGSGILLAPFLLLRIVYELWMPNGEIAFFQLRARAYSSGLSPIVSLTLLGGAVLVWIVCELRRSWLAQRQDVKACALDVLCSSERSIQGCRHRLNRIQGLLERIFPGAQRPDEHPWLLPLSVFVPLVVLLWGTLQPIMETRNYGRVFVVCVVLTTSLASLSFYRFVRVWWNLRGVLLRLDHASPRLAKTFEKLAPEIDWKPMRSFGFRIPPFKMLLLSIAKLRAMLEIKPLSGVSEEEVGELMRRVFEADGRDRQGDEIDHRKALSEVFNAVCQELEKSPASLRLPAVREFLAVQIAAYLRYVFAHLRNSLIGALGTGLLLLLAVSSYAFEPKQFLSFVVWASLAVAALLTLWIFLQMDRNPTLSRIGGTTAGQVTLDRTLVANVFIYGAVPALGVIATQFPEVGQVLGQIVDPLLRVTGGG
ncbi:MAG TPA: hypothetical protein VF789_33000 [Thermoanaerobaculia bacterium]